MHPLSQFSHNSDNKSLNREIKIVEEKPKTAEHSDLVEHPQEQLSEADSAMKKAFQSISQQNAYLEEMNKFLQSKFEQEKKTSTVLKASEQKLRKELDQSIEKVRSLEEKLSALEAEMKKFKEIFQQQIQEARDDAVQERKSFQNTKGELNNLYQKEKRLREQAEEAFDRAMMKHAEAESKVSHLEQESENAKLAFDHERCEGNKEARLFLTPCFLFVIFHPSLLCPCRKVSWKSG